MNPRLIAISGPLKGTTFHFTEEETSIGRAQGNKVSIADVAASRRHCVIKRDGASFTVRDLESRNGTFVNGVPVIERELRHGDRIEVGDSLMLFLLEEGEVPVSASVVELADGNRLVTHPTAVLRRQDAFYLQADRTSSGRPPTARLARDLDALLRISTTINSIRETDTLQRRLLELIFEIIPAERGAILLVADNLDEFRSVFGQDRRPGAGAPVQVSRTIIDQVLREGVSIVSNDVGSRDARDSSESLIASRTTSLLAVPLLLFERVMGVIYLDTSNPKSQFDEEHLQLLTGIAAIAAVALDNVRRLEWLAYENRRLQEEIRVEHNMVGESAQMRQVHQLIGRAAPQDSTVLIRGESGTGKELVARAIHRNSPRADKPFVAINCAAIPEHLLESELFGYEKGAFTGALQMTRGKLEVANGGTIFLDEVSELAPTLQAKLLRVLQEREFERLGGTRPIKVDLRLIAATNRDLDEAIARGAFRRDLFFRLNVISIYLAPLRERRDDIPLLTTYFVTKYSKKCNRKIMGISPEARACLLSYDWPGNVRELENAIERAVVVGSADLIRPEDLPETVMEKDLPPGVHRSQYHEVIKDTKKKLIIQALERSNGNYTEAAKWLDIHANYLHRLIKNLDMKAELRRLEER